MRTTAPLTPGAVDGTFIAPARDALALNREQARAMVNDTPQVDSVLEHLSVLHRLPHHERARVHLAGLASLVRDVAVSNHAEAGCERDLIASAESLAVDLRDLCLNGDGTGALGVKAAARAVRGPLRALAASADTASVVRAARDLDRVLSKVPRVQLMQRSLRHELGDAHWRLLSQIVEDRP